MQQDDSRSSTFDAVRFTPDRGKLLSSAIPMTVFAVICALFALSFMSIAWLGVALFGLLALRSWAALVPDRGWLEISDQGVEYRHGLRAATIPWSSLRACQVVNLAHGDPADDAVRLIWDERTEQRWIDVDGAYADPQSIAQAIADAHARAVQLLSSAAESRYRTVESASRDEKEMSGAPSDDMATPEPRRRAWATLGLLAVIVASTGWEFVRWGMSPTVEGLARSGGMSIGAVLRDEWWSVAAANLLHANLLHVGMNCLVIILLGSGIERAFGKLAVIGCTLVACVTASLGSLMIDDASVMIGASGIGFALMGFAFAADPRATTGVGRVARQLLPINLIITFAGAGSISVGGHLGGLVAGIATGMIVVRRLQPPSMRRSLAVVAVGGVLLATLCTMPRWSPDTTVRVQRQLGSWLVARQVAHRIRSNNGGDAIVHCTPRASSVVRWRCTVDGSTGLQRVLVSYTSPDDQFRAVPI